MNELIEALGNLVAINGKDRVLDAFIEICDPRQHKPEVRELNPGLDHDWEVLKAAQLVEKVLTGAEFKRVDKVNFKD